ncbi:hypothetical protein F7P83_04780 [Brevibacterium luteolum]|nr:hypothetical protein [Brevibacterium luteolum]
MTRIPTRKTRLSALALAVSIAVLGTACSPTSDSGGSSAAAGADQQAASDFARGLGDKIAAHWPHVTKVWPGTDDSDHVAVLFHLDDKGEVVTAFTVDTSGTRELTDSERTGLTPPPPGGYSPSEFGGKPAVLLAVDAQQMQDDPRAEELYLPATHELVHFYHQGEVAFDGGEARAQNYPIDARPRVLREMTYDSLVKAAENPAAAASHLAHAKHWHEQWKKEFGDEYAAIKTTEIVEGHARYLENLADIQTGETTPEQVQAEAVKRIRKGTVLGSADAESYEIGYVAALLLDRQNPEWKKDFLAGGATFTDKLMEKVAPAAQDVDPKIEKSVTGSISKLNDEIRTAIEPLTTALKDTSVPYLRIDTSQFEGSYGGEHFIVVDGREVTTAFTNTYPTDGGDIRIDRAAVMPSEAEVTVPLPKDATFADGKLTVDGNGVSADAVPAEKTTDADGRTVYTVTATG